MHEVIKLRDPLLFLRDDRAPQPNEIDDEEQVLLQLDLRTIARRLVTDVDRNEPTRQA